MTTSPLPIDWSLLQHIGSRITWTATTYQHFGTNLAVSPSPTPPESGWYRLPFEPVQLDKLPERQGLYAFVYTYLCLGFPEQQIVLYLGETENLRNRLGNYNIQIQKRTGKAKIDNLANTREERLDLMFSQFHDLELLYCTLELTKWERKHLERNLIRLLDPPFNWHHRAIPKIPPIIGRPGGISTRTGQRRPAFQN